MEKKAKINNIINKLTSNEDHRQDLWLCHLEGNSVEDFELYLDHLRITSMKEESFKIILSDSKLNLIELFKHFTDLEQSIMSLLIIGLHVQEISQYKGISIVRISQIIENIKRHDRWNKWHSKPNSLIEKSTV